MSKFVMFTIKGEPRLVNVDKIHIVDYDSGAARLYMSDPSDPEPWPVDQSFDEVVHAIASCTSVFNAIAGAITPADDIYDALSKFAALNPQLKVTVETDHGTVSAKLGDCNIYEACDHSIIFDAE